MAPTHLGLIDSKDGEDRWFCAALHDLRWGRTHGRTAIRSELRPGLVVSGGGVSVYISPDRLDAVHR